MLPGVVARTCSGPTKRRWTSSCCWPLAWRRPAAWLSRPAGTRSSAPTTRCAWASVGSPRPASNGCDCRPCRTWRPCGQVSSRAAPATTASRTRRRQLRPTRGQHLGHVEEVPAGPAEQLLRARCTPGATSTTLPAPSPCGTPACTCPPGDDADMQMARPDTGVRRRSPPRKGQADPRRRWRVRRLVAARLVVRPVESRPRSDPCCTWSSSATPPGRDPSTSGPPASAACSLTASATSTAGSTPRRPWTGASS